MTTFFEWAVLVMAFCTITCMTRKFWWAPIVGLAQELAWFGFAIMIGSIPIFLLAIVYAVTYAFAIPKWYKEKRK